MPQYAVMFRPFKNDLIYYSEENPFNMYSKPLLFLNKEAAETFASKLNTGIVVEYGGKVE
jgi:hypothetical protein